MSAATQESTWIKRLGSCRPIRALLSTPFQVDDLFGSFDWGIGILAIARRSPPGMPSDGSGCDAAAANATLVRGPPPEAARPRV